MVERRRHKRFRVDVMEINGKMMLAEEVAILDLSVGGVSLRADRRLNIGHEYVVKMENAGKILTVKGFVVWSVLTGNKEGPRGDSIPLYTAGMKFTDASEKKAEEIVSFIESHSRGIIKQVAPHGMNCLRQSVRVRIDIPENTTVDFPENYRVLILSLGGLLMESERQMELESRLSMEVFFPGNTSIAFAGRIASCRQLQEGTKKIFHIGIEFLDMPEEHREKLQEFIFSLGAMKENALSDQ